MPRIKSRSRTARDMGIAPECGSKPMEPIHHGAISTLDWEFRLPTGRHRLDSEIHTDTAYYVTVTDYSQVDEVAARRLEYRHACLHSLNE